MPDPLGAPAVRPDPRSERLREGERRAGRAAVASFTFGVTMVLLLLAGSIAFAAWCQLGVKNALMLFAVLLYMFLTIRGVQRRKRSERERIGLRHRWRSPIRWPRTQAPPTRPADPAVVSLPRLKRARGPRGGRWASEMPIATAFLVLLLIVVVVSALAVTRYR